MPQIAAQSSPRTIKHIATASTLGMATFSNQDFSSQGGELSPSKNFNSVRFGMTSVFPSHRTTAAVN